VRETPEPDVVLDDHPTKGETTMDAKVKAVNAKVKALKSLLAQSKAQLAQLEAQLPNVSREEEGDFIKGLGEIMVQFGEELKKLP
jgi:predicted RNase H-like nuclease (RuvC/YqgF family)